MPTDNNESCNNVSTTCDGSPPANWNYFRSTEDWHPGEAVYASKQPAQQISNRQFMGASGKSWVRYHESSETNQSTFGDDALLLKQLGAEYDDVYVSFWIKMDPNWKWVSAGSAKFKLVRVFILMAQMERLILGTILAMAIVALSLSWILSFQINGGFAQHILHAVIRN